MHLCHSNLFNYLTRTTMIKSKVKPKSPYTMIQEAETLLQEGDLIVRLNKAPTSFYIQQFNRVDKSYSHAGIVLIEKGKPVVYHLSHGSENPEDKVCCFSIARFCDPQENLAFAIFR